MKLGEYADLAAVGSFDGYGRVCYICDARHAPRGQTTKIPVCVPCAKAHAISGPGQIVLTLPEPPPPAPEIPRFMVRPVDESPEQTSLAGATTWFSVPGFP